MLPADLIGQALPHPEPGLVDRDAVDYGVGTRQIDVLEDARVERRAGRALLAVEVPVHGGVREHGDERQALRRELRLLIGRLEDFAAQVENGLETADWLTRRGIIRMLVSRVEIDHTKVNIVFRVPQDPFVASPDALDRGVLQHCRRRDLSAVGQHRPARTRSRVGGPM